MRVRTVVVGTRFTPEEIQLIKELASSRGLSLSGQVREALMLHVVRVGKSIIPRAKNENVAA